MTGDVFSWNVFFERTGFLYNYSQKLSGRLLNFCPVFGSVVKIAFLVCGGTFRGKIFFPKKVNFIFGFWSTKIWFWETTRHVCKNCPYVEKRTMGATFFENVISRIIIFRSWAKHFLPSMERVWHGCEKGILRDQTTFEGAYYFKVQETKLFGYFQA